MPRNELTTSAAGLAALERHEGCVPGLYDDARGFATYGVGHLVHRHGSILLSRARALPEWSARLGLFRRRIAYFNRELADHPDFDRFCANAARAAEASAIDLEAALLRRLPREVLAEDVRRFEEAVNAAITGVPLEQDEFDALVSLAFNIGAARFTSSDLVASINAGGYRSGTLAVRRQAMEEIAAAFCCFNRAGGEVLRGLARRRRDEAARFLRCAAAECDTGTRDS